MVCHIFFLKIRTAKVKGFAGNAKANTREFLRTSPKSSHFRVPRQFLRFFTFWQVKFSDLSLDFACGPNSTRNKGITLIHLAVVKNQVTRDLLRS
jgi:hypothetical protein